MSGAEDNNVENPNTVSADDQLTILAGICLDATPELKEVINLYDPKNGTDKHFAEFSKCGKKDLQAALEFLNVKKEWKQYKKENVVEELICRIQNLLPSRCDTCGKPYVTTKEQLPLLPCEICGNDVHRDCMAISLGIDAQELTNEIVRQTLNPFGFPGLHYICHMCRPTTIPSKTYGMTKHAIKSIEKKNAKPDQIKNRAGSVVETNQTKAPSQNSQIINVDDETIHSSQIPTSSNGDPPSMLSNPSVDLKKQVSFDVDLKKQVSFDESTGRDPSEEDSEGWKTIKPNVCRNFLKGDCRHGMSGKSNGTCKFLHLKMCNKLLKHGTKEGLGCDKGKNCENFHPKMCSMSLAKGECFNKSCKLKHVKGTRRVKRGPRARNRNQNENGQSSNKPRNQQSHGSENTSTNQDFQDALHNLQTTMMKSVEEKLSAVVAQMTKLIQSQMQIQQHPMQIQHPVQRIPQYPTMHQFPMMQQQQNTQQMAGVIMPAGHSVNQL